MPSSEGTAPDAVFFRVFLNMIGVDLFMIKSLTSRRKFLSLLGISSVAGPKVAKEISDALIMDQAEVGVVHPGQYSHMLSPGPLASEEGDTEDVKVARYLQMFGVPEWYEENMIRNYRHYTSITPHFASIRSMSVSAKITASRKEYVRHHLRDALDLKGKLMSQTAGRFWRKIIRG